MFRFLILLLLVLFPAFAQSGYENDDEDDFLPLTDAPFASPHMPQRSNMSCNCKIIYPLWVLCTLIFILCVLQLLQLTVRLKQKRAMLPMQASFGFEMQRLRPEYNN